MTYTKRFEMPLYHMALNERREALKQRWEARATEDDSITKAREEEAEKYRTKYSGWTFSSVCPSDDIGEVQKCTNMKPLNIYFVGMGASTHVLRGLWGRQPFTKNKELWVSRVEVWADMDERIEYRYGDVDDYFCGRYRRTLWTVDATKVLYEYAVKLAEDAFYELGENVHDHALFMLEQRKAWLRGEVDRLPHPALFEGPVNRLQSHSMKIAGALAQQSPEDAVKLLVELNVPVGHSRNIMLWQYPLFSEYVNDLEARVLALAPKDEVTG